MMMMITLLSLSHASETAVGCKTGIINTDAEVINSIRGVCGVSRRPAESNEDMYRRFGMVGTAEGVNCSG